MARCSGELLKKIVTSVVKNEQDIIRAFVNHHLSVADEVWILDDGSSDATRQILVEIAAKEARLFVRTEQSTDKQQSSKMTSLARTALDHSITPTWVFPLDADEFLVPEAHFDFYLEEVAHCFTARRLQLFSRHDQKH